MWSNYIPLQKQVRISRRRGYRFRKCVKTLSGTPDIVLPKYRTVIFVNGCFWRRRSDREFARAEVRRKRLVREEVERELQEQFHIPVKIWKENVLTGENISWLWQALWAPSVVEKDGRYFFYFGANDVHEGEIGGIGVAVSDSPFERIGKILQADPEVGTGAGHHSVLKGRGKDEWYIVYHRHPLGSTDGNDRVVCIDRMYFEPDGTIRPVKITFEGVKKTRSPKKLQDKK